MENKAHAMAAGLFVVVAAALLLMLAAWLTRDTGPRDAYEISTRTSISGLQSQAAVRYRGVDVGKVKDIQLVPDNPQQVQLVFAIDHGTPIKTDTIATLTTQGLTGIGFIELSGGSPNAPLLVPRVPGELPVIPTKPSLTARLEQVLTRVMGSVDKTSRTIDGVFTDANKKAFADSLANIAAVTQTLADRRGSIDAALKNADVTMANAARVSARLDQTLARVDQAAASFDRMSADFDKTANNANQTITNVGADVQRFTNETVPQLENLMNELSVLSASLRRLSEQTERNPKSLIFGKTPVPKGPGE